jgi:hypothetical protein
MPLLLVGLWTAIIGYGILYTGVTKLGGNPGYHLGDAFRGKAPAGSSSTGTGGPLRRTDFGALQRSMIPDRPV